MDGNRHLTTRRGFVATMGFGAVGLYGLWAAYGAAPLPFGGGGGNAVPADDHGGGHGGHGGGGGGMLPEEFRRLTGDFVQRFRQPDGSVRPMATPAAPASHDAHGGHGGHGGHGDHGATMTMAMESPDAVDPRDVYLMAEQWRYEPDRLRLEVGKPYRFRMMAMDVPHGASIQLGPASRIIRLRPDTLVESTITFQKPGEYLVYCTVFCGSGHDAMHGRIIVA